MSSDSTTTSPVVSLEPEKTATAASATTTATTTTTADAAAAAASTPAASDATVSTAAPKKTKASGATNPPAKRHQAEAPKPQAKGIKRIQREWADVTLNPTAGIQAGPKNLNNMFEWMATLEGPKDSPYEGGVFYLDITLPKDYPFVPPVITFKTRIYHCNINEKGGICLDLLKTNWSAALTIQKILLSISSLLADPNPEDPLVPDIAKEYKDNRARHDQTAKEFTARYASKATSTTPPPS